MGIRKSGEKSSLLCLPGLLKLQQEATNHNKKRGQAIAHSYSLRKKKKKQGEKKKKKGENPFRCTTHDKKGLFVFVVLLNLIF